MDPEPKPASRERPLTVADLVRWANHAVERYGLLWVEAEAAEVKRPVSGHVYFVLRDKGAVIPAVMGSARVARNAGPARAPTAPHTSRPATAA